MKISFFLPHFQVYGGIRRVIEISNVLMQLGHDVTVFHSDGTPCDWMKLNAPTRSLEDALNVSHHHLIYLMHEQWDDVARMQSKHRYFYCCNLYNAKLLSVPLFFLSLARPHSHQLHKAFHLKKALSDNKAHLIANCTAIKNDIKKYTRRDADVVFGGVNRDIFYPTDLSHDVLSPKLLFLGSTKPWKGEAVIKEATEMVRRRYPNIELRSFANKGISQNKMATVYGEADIVVDAQYYAGWNNPVAEAMACKIPVVCGDVEFNKDIAINGETALMVAVDNPKAYARAITRLLEDRKLRNTLVDNAYKKIASFTWGKAANNLIAILSHNA